MTSSAAGEVHIVGGEGRWLVPLTNIIKIVLIHLIANSLNVYYIVIIFLLCNEKDKNWLVLEGTKGIIFIWWTRYEIY